MKKRILLVSATALMLAANVSAQDVTPAKFKFQELSLGEYMIDGFGKGANPEGIVLTDPGTVVCGLGPASANAAAFDEEGFNKMKTAIETGTSIVNSEFGHLLMIKGKDSKETEGNSATESLNTKFWNMAFVGPESTSFKDKKYRATIQMKLVTDMEASETVVLKFAYVTSQNVGINEREVIYRGDKGWFQAQIEGTIGTTGATRCRVSFPGGLMDQSALYIYEVRFEAGATTELVNSPNDGTPGMDKPYGAAAVGLDQLTGNSSFVTWDNTAIYVNNAISQNVEVYNIGGQLVYSAVADKNLMEISMAKGVYVVKVGSKSTKVVL